MDLGLPYGLAFSSGLNAYLPMLALALASDIWPHQFKINPQFAFLSQPWVLALFAILALLDVFADKIPVVDHLWDLVHTIIRPVAGALVAAAASNHMTGAELLIPLLAGGSIAGITHTTKAATRVASTATTAGCLNIVISIVEDVVMAVSVVLSLVAPYVMVVVVALFIVTFLLMIPRILRLFRRRPRQPQGPGPQLSNRVPIEGYRPRGS